MEEEQNARVMDAVRRIVQALHMSSRQSERELGLSSAQLFVLQKLASGDGQALSLSQLASLTLTHPSSVSVVVRRLAERGFLQCTAAATDRRRMEVVLTEAGRRMASERPLTAQERLAEALQRLPSAQQKALADALNSWIDMAALSNTDAPMFFERQEDLGGERVRS